MPSRIGDALHWYATYTPDKIAIIGSEGVRTYRELLSGAQRLASALTGLGLEPADRLAILLPNSPLYLEIYQAAALLGIAVVPLNTRFHPSEIDYIVDHSQARALIFDPALAETVSELRERWPAIGDRYISTGPAGEGAFLSYEQLVAHGEERMPAVPADLEACYFQGYTSGTTGFPKGCVNPHRAFADCLRRMATLYDVTSNDVELVCAPLFHEAPALFALMQLFCGGTVVVTPDAAPSTVLAAVERHRATFAFMVPTMWASLVTSPEIDDHDLGSLRAIMSGGSPLLTQTKEALLERLPEAGLNEFYGGTEIGLVTNLGPADQRRKVRSVGRPVPGLYVELRGDDGTQVGLGEIGEIYVGGATLLREYFRNPEATAAARQGDFLTLGDMGRFDDEGYLHIVDRRKDMIISGGENIFPNDIEEILYRHPAVAMAAVVGAPDPKWGEIVVAAVTLKPGQAVDEATLIAHCKASLASFKVPKKVEFRTSMPLSSFGKILRREIRQPYWKSASVQI